MDCLVTPIDSPFQIWLAVILDSGLCNAVQTGRQTGPIHNEKQLEDRVEMRQKAVGIALGMNAETKALAVHTPEATLGGGWGLATVPIWRRFPFQSLAWMILLYWNMEIRGSAALSLLQHRG